MPVRAEKLTQRIHAICEFAIAHFQDQPDVSEISTELDGVIANLERKTLKLHLLGIPDDLSAGDSVKPLLPLLKSSPAIESAYQICCLTPESRSDAVLELDCDVLCCVLPPTAELTDVLKQFMYAAGNQPIAKRLLILDDISEDATAPLTTVAAETDFEIHHLPLQSLYETSPENLARERSLKQFLKVLESLVRRKPEDVLAQRLSTAVIAQVERLEEKLEEAIAQVDQELKAELDQVKQSGSATSQILLSPEARTNFEQDLKQIQDRSKVLFKQIKIDLEESQNDLLNEFHRRGVTYQIQQFVRQLQPIIIRQGRKKYVQLQSEFSLTTADVNIDMVQLCYDHLHQWAIAEWKRVYSVYQQGGVNQLFQDAMQTMIRHSLTNCPGLSPALLRPMQTTPDLKRFKEPIAAVPCESNYKSVSIGNYLIRQIRNQWMGVMFLFTFLTMVGIANNKQAIIGGLLAPFRHLQDEPLWMTVVIAIPLILIFFLLFQSYDDDGEQRLNDEADKLKKNLATYYQKFAAYTTDVLVKDLTLMLDAEEQHLQTQLAQIRDSLYQQCLQMAQQQAIAQQHQKQILEKQKALQKSKQELQKLKQL